MYPLLKAHNLSRQVGHQAALEDVNLRLCPGEVVGLADRDGIGKSMLISILAGQEPPDSGWVEFDQQRLSWPFQPPRFHINVIHEQPELADWLDVTSNIFLGNELCRPFFGKWLRVPNQTKMDMEAKRLLASLDVHLPSLHETAANLSNEQRQMVAIAQVLVRSSKLVVMDNPETSLSYPYQKKLLELIRGWQEEGTAVLFSSKILDHLFAVSDRILVFRQGRLVANVRTDETNREEVVAALVGTADRQQRTPVIWALDSYYRARKQAEILQHNETLLKRDLKAQDSLNRQLVDQLARQVKALDSANLALQDAQRRLLTEREQERKHLARELHDQMIQDLLSLNYQLEEVEEKTSAMPDLAKEVADVRSNIRFLVEELRRICGNLRPPTIDSLGLDAALKSYTREWSQRTGIEVILDIEADFGRLPEAIELSIFRILQESLNNVWKHANASQVTVSLTHTSPRMLLLSIADNGTGLPHEFDLATLGQNGHYGLLGLSERVALMEGKLNVQNQPSGGLILQVEIPHPRVSRARWQADVVEGTYGTT